MKDLTKLGIYGYQQIPQSKSCNRALNPSYFKFKEASNTAPRLNTRLVELKGGEFDHLFTYVKSN